VNKGYLSLNKDSFKLLKEAKKLFIYSDQYIYENFPKNKKHLKIMYFDECKSLIDNIVMGNNTSGSIRKKYQNNAFLNLSNMDFLITYFYDLEIINVRRYSSAIRLMNNIKKLLLGWINEESK
jgi:hypothetical protein